MAVTLLVYHHHIFGILTYARSDIKNIKLLSSSIGEDIQRIDVKVERMKVVSIYKPSAAI